MSVEQEIYNTTHAYSKCSLLVFLALPYSLSALGENDSDPFQWSSLAQFSAGAATLFLWVFWFSLQSAPGHFGIDTTRNTEDQRAADTEAAAATLLLDHQH